MTGRLTDLAAELRDAERAMDGARIRELSAARRRLVDDLTAQALAPLKAPPFALREEVMATFDAAIADPGVAASLGTLVRAAHWPASPGPRSRLGPRRRPAPRRRPGHPGRPAAPGQKTQNPRPG